MMSFAPKRRMGWLPDYPDFRDYTEDTDAIQDLLHPESAATSGRAATAVSRKRAAAARAAVAAKAAFPSAVDLRPWCSPVEDQGNWGQSPYYCCRATQYRPHAFAAASDAPPQNANFKDLTPASLIDIARKKQARGMTTAWNKVKEKMAKEAAGKQPRVKTPENAEEVFKWLGKAIAKLDALDAAAWTEDEKSTFNQTLLGLEESIHARLTPPA